MRRPATGLSLVELAATLAVGAVLLALAIPSFMHLRGTTLLGGAAQEFLSDFRFARSEAIRRGDVVMLCRVASATDTDCATTASARGWADGWIVAHDRNRNQSIEADEVLRRHEGWQAAVSIADSRGTPRPIQFAPAGRLLNLSSAATLRFAGDGAAQASAPLCLSISMGARTQMLKGAECA